MEIFDKIWEHYSKDGNLPQTTQNPFLKIPLNKKHSKKQTTKYLAFYNSEIRYFKDKGYTQCKGILPFSFDVTVEWLYLGKVDGNQSMLPPLMGFQLERTQKEISFYTQSEGNLIMIQNFLKGRVNQRNVHYYYRAIKKLGKGSFAIVYLLENKQNGKQFAAKFFNKKSYYKKKSGKESIINEINILRSLSHPNILKLYEVYETQHSIYMVMDLLHGGHLRDKIRENKMLTESETAIIVSSLLQSVHHMGQNKVMHRDIKPENLMYQDLEQTKIILVDFGLATFWDEKTYMYPRCGTPGFIAPEIANNKDPNAHYTGICDLFSIGCVMHLALTGKPVFRGKTHYEILLSNKLCQLDFTDEMYSPISGQAMDLMKQLLERLPENRISVGDAQGHPFILINACSENIGDDDGEDNYQKMVQFQKKYENFVMKNPFSDKQCYKKANKIEECCAYLEETPTFQTKKIDSKGIKNKNLLQLLSNHRRQKKQDSFVLIPQRALYYINSQCNNSQQMKNSQEELDAVEQYGSQFSASINQEGIQQQVQQMNEISQLNSGFQPPQKLLTSPIISFQQQQNSKKAKTVLIQDKKAYNNYKTSQFNQQNQNASEFIPPTKISTSPHIQLITKIEPLANLKKK